MVQPRLPRRRMLLISALLLEYHLEEMIPIPVMVSLLLKMNKWILKVCSVYCDCILHILNFRFS